MSVLIQNEEKIFENCLLLTFWSRAESADKGRDAPETIQKIPSDVSGLGSAATVTVVSSALC